MLPSHRDGKFAILAFNLELMLPALLLQCSWHHWHEGAKAVIHDMCKRVKMDWCIGRHVSVVNDPA